MTDAKTNQSILASRFLPRSELETGEPLDRIFVSDLVLDCEVGVFAEEHGITQKVRFDVAMEVRPHTGAMTDNIDNVISYDVIVDGIKSVVNAGHIRLLETVAERIADQVLAYAGAVRAHIRIEKLEKEPGGVGVEIVRRAPPPDAPNVYQLTQRDG